MAPRETENSAFLNFGGDEQRALWYVMVFFWSGQLGCLHLAKANKVMSQQRV